MARVGVRSDTGKLFFDFKWGGKRRREQTALDDTPPNRKRAEQVLRALCVDIERGQFEYLKYFPNSPVATNPQQNLNAPKADSSSPPRSDTPPPSRPQLRDFAETWYDENEVRWRRTTRGLMRVGFYPVSTDGWVKSLKAWSLASSLRWMSGLWNRSM